MAILLGTEELCAVQLLQAPGVLKDEWENPGLCFVGPAGTDTQTEAQASVSGALSDPGGCTECPGKSSGRNLAPAAAWGMLRGASEGELGSSHSGKAEETWRRRGEGQPRVMWAPSPSTEGWTGAACMSVDRVRHCPLWTVLPTCTVRSPNRPTQPHQGRMEADPAASWPHPVHFHWLRQ